MIHYQDQNGAIHAIEDRAHAHLLPAGCRELSDAEVSALRAPTPEQIAAKLEAAVDAHIDSVARSDKWDSRITCVMRAGYPNPWQTRAVAFGEWMDACYAYCYQVQSDVAAGTRAVPTEAELIAELPVMVWPG